MFVKSTRFFLIVIILFLTGCAAVHENLGISELEWSSYSPEKQKKLLSNYGEISKEKNIRKEKGDGVLGDVYLAVSLSQGKIMFPPSFVNWQSYKPVKFNVREGQCLDVDVKSKVNDEIKTELGVCFKENILYLDPSHYDLDKKYGTVTFHSSPLWTSGFDYEGINSCGFVKLHDVTVKVNRLESPPEKND